MSSGRAEELGAEEISKEDSLLTRSLEMTYREYALEQSRTLRTGNPQPNAEIVTFAPFPTRSLSV